jgi:predicted dehydrogenase
MPAMCMRFWPGWVWLRERIRDGTLGSVRSATFQRLGSPPDWSGFYADVERSGGALVDLHIHDADFIRWCFGDPAEVVSTGSVHHVTTLYRFPGGPAHVVAEGGQDLSPGFGFAMRYTVAFEHATADFDLTRSPAVRLSRDGRSQGIEVPVMSAYDAEVRHLVGAIATGSRPESLRASLDDAARTAALLEAERESLASGRLVRFV